MSRPDYISLFFFFFFFFAQFSPSLVSAGIFFFNFFVFDSLASSGNLNRMGQQISKEEELYQQVSYGNTEGIKRLCSEGARLEWMDREGKTPLIVACMNPVLYNVAKTLIELGANVNSYRPGRHAGTPLHHAAKRGLERTVMLLLVHGANALVMNDDCQTPLDVARAKGHCNVVRAIENHICLFSGWMREFYGPGFLEALAPQLVSRKVLVVVLPAGSRNPTKPFKLELAIYYRMQDAQPRTVVALWKANLEDPKLRHSDPSVIILDSTTRTRIKLASANEGDRQQLKWFCDACKGIPHANPVFLRDDQAQVTPASAPPSAEDDLELAMAVSASVQSAMQEKPPIDAYLNSEASTSNTSTSCANISSPPTSCSDGLENNDIGNSTQPNDTQENLVVGIANQPDSIPSAPPISDDITNDVPIHYPSIDSSPIDLLPPLSESLPDKTSGQKVERHSSSCVICLDAPVEGACIPCGHMAGCMSCLNEVKAKKWGCPVCRAKIDQIVRLYAV